MTIYATMQFPTVGDYVLVQQFKKPPWPALVCPDDMAPQNVLASRPNPYYTLTLLIKDKPEFLYVSTTDMQEFDPFLEAESHTPLDDGLRQAYDRILNEAMDSGLSSTEYWRNMTSNQRNLEPPLSPTFDPSEESDEDIYVKEAIRLSLADLQSKTKSLSPTAMTPSPKTEKGFLVPSPSLSPPPKRRKRRIAPKSSSPKEFGDIRRHFHVTAEGSSSSSSERVPKRAKTEALDIVEGELADSDQFVTILVGKEKAPFYIPISEVKKRPYLANDKIGCLRTNGDGTSVIEIRGLEEINPEDFRFAAEYLEGGKFGHHVIDDENREEAMAQCVAAWEVGDLLGMEDLLEHIASKVERVLPWASSEVLAFAIIVYRTEGRLLDGHAKMKDMLTEYLAKHFFDMISEHGQEFVGRLQKLPELERDVYQMMANKAGERMD